MAISWEHEDMNIPEQEFFLGHISSQGSTQQVLAGNLGK